MRLAKGPGNVYPACSFKEFRRMPLGMWSHFSWMVNKRCKRIVQSAWRQTHPKFLFGMLDRTSKIKGSKTSSRRANLDTIFIGQDASASLNISVGLTVGVKEPLFFNHYGRQKKEGGSAASSCPSCTTRLCQYVRMSYSINRSYQLKGIRTYIAELILTAYRRKKHSFRSLFAERVRKVFQTRHSHCIHKIL